MKKLMYINYNYCQFLVSSDSGLGAEVSVNHLVILNVNILILEWITALPKLTVFFCTVLSYHIVSYYSVSYYAVLTMADRKIEVSGNRSCFGILKTKLSRKLEWSSRRDENISAYTSLSHKLESLPAETWEQLGDMLLVDLDGIQPSLMWLQLR